MPLEIFSPLNYSKRLVEDPLTPPATPNNSQCIGAIVSELLNVRKGDVVTGPELTLV